MVNAGKMRPSCAHCSVTIHLFRMVVHAGWWSVADNGNSLASILVANTILVSVSEMVAKGEQEDKIRLRYTTQINKSLSATHSSSDVQPVVDWPPRAQCALRISGLQVRRTHVMTCLFVRVRLAIVPVCLLTNDVAV